MPTCVAQELVAAGFIKGQASGIISPYSDNKVPDVFVISRTLAAVATSAPFPVAIQNVIEINNLPVDAAEAIDRKMDDDARGAGDVRGASGVGNTVTLDIAL